MLPSEIAEAAPRRTDNLKVLALFVALAAIVVVGHMTPLRHQFDNVVEWKQWLRDQGAWGPLVFTLGTGVLVGLGVPRLVFCFLGGAAFGFVAGFIWAQVGTLIGAYAIFLMVRWGGLGWVHRRVASHPRIVAMADKSPNFWTVFLIRQIPAPGLLPNVMLGLTRIPHRAFLIGSLLGFLPEAVIITLAGSGLIKGSLADALPRVITALGLFLVLGWVLRHLIISRRTATSPA